MLGLHRERQDFMAGANVGTKTGCWQVYCCDVWVGCDRNCCDEVVRSQAGLIAILNELQLVLDAQHSNKSERLSKSRIMERSLFGLPEMPCMK